MFIVVVGSLVGCSARVEVTSTSSSAPPAPSTLAETSSSTAMPGEASHAAGGAEPIHDCPNRSTGSSPKDLGATGTFAAHLVKVDERSRQLQFDMVQWLVGEDAVVAYHAENPTEPDGPPADYWIANENPLVRAAPVAADASVLLVRLAQDQSADLDAGTLDELPDYLTQPTSPHTTWWLTFSAGTITQICEQYTP